VYIEGLAKKGEVPTEQLKQKVNKHKGVGKKIFVKEKGGAMRDLISGSQVRGRKIYRGDKPRIGGGTTWRWRQTPV